MRDRVVWALRCAWFTLPLTVGPALTKALDDAAGRTEAFALGTAWTLWAVGLVCVAVLLPATLTGVRVLAPVVLVAASWGLLAAANPLRAMIAVAAAVVVVALAFSSLVGDRHVDGASYGDERRMLLRPPARLAVIVAPVTWLVAAVSALGGVAALAAGKTAVGVVALVLGVPICAIALRALHQLSRRWIVFVPTGFVLHDLLVLTEPVLFRRTAVERLGPAVAGTPAKDLSNHAAGLMLECELTDPAPLGLRGSNRGEAALVDVRRFMFVPTLPGELLDEAERRRLPVD